MIEVSVDIDLEREAEKFAELAHTHINQKRKYTEDPYIVHPRNVAYLVKCAGGSEDMICAAYLHDVIEDVAPKCPMFTDKIIEEHFGANVHRLVRWLTDCGKEHGNREERHKINMQRLNGAPAKAATIKLADLIDNSLTIVKYDPNFAKVYLREKRKMLDSLRHGSRTLWLMADEILTREGY